MTDILCRCGSPKSHHIVDFGKVLGSPITDNMLEILKGICKIQIDKYSCRCLEYKQDNLSYLEAKATEKGI